MGTASSRFLGNPKRYLASVFYYGFARHLPWSPRPFGNLARRLRALAAAQMLDYCGRNVNVEHGARFGSGKGIRLGDRSDIGMDSLVIGPLHIGTDCMMGPRCILIASNHEYAGTDVPMNQQGFREDSPIVIEDDVWIGAGVTIVAGRRIGKGSIVAASAVVTRDVPAYSIVGGNPAKVLGTRKPSTP